MNKRPIKSNYYNLEVGDKIENGKGYTFTIKELLPDCEVSISFREDRPPLIINAYNAFKGRVVNPYIADEFIGQKFTTPRGGVFTIINLLPREYYPNGVLRNAKYEATCSICSKDKELNPEPFLIDKSNFLLGKELSFNCQCGIHSNEIYNSEYKSKVLLKRSLEGSSLRLFSCWKGNTVNKKIQLYCSKHRKIIHTELPRVLSSKVSLCRPCRDDILNEEVLLRKREEIENKFNITNFKVKGSKKRGFTFECGYCKEDGYSKESNCRFIFPYSYSSFVNLEQLPCRCRLKEKDIPTFRWDKGEREHQIKSILQKEGIGYFTGWVDGYVGCKSKFKWVCSREHLCETVLHGFISKGNRCSTCADMGRSTSWSYNPDLEGKVDYLYTVQLSNDSEKFVKIGRTIDLKRRFGEYTCMFKMKVVKIFQGVYEDVWVYEKNFHERNKESHFPVKTSFYGKTECYNLGTVVKVGEEPFLDITEKIISDYNYTPLEEYNE